MRHGKFMLMVALVLMALTSAMYADTANSMLLCVSDTDFGCFGSSSGNAVSLFWNGTTLSTGTNGDGTIITGTNTSNSIVVNATLGSFSFNLTSGVFSPDPNTAMDLHSLNVNSGGAGSLYLVFGADNYTSNSAYALSAGGTLTGTTGSVTNTSCFEYGNGSYYICGSNSFAPNFGTATTSASGAWTLGFNGSMLPPTNPYGLEEDVLVNFNGAGTFSGDFALTTPEPGTLAMLGSGLIALAAGLRRKLAR